MRIKEGKSTLFLIHQHADPDAIGSSYYLSRIFSGDVASPTSPNKSGKNLLSFLNFEIQHSVNFEDYEQVIVLDTSGPDQLAPLDPPSDGTLVLVIDHHLSNSWGEEVELHFEDRTSCSEIVYEITDTETLTRKEGIALAAGILTDTSFLKRGDSRTFLSLGEILEKSGIDLYEVKDILYERRSYSEKVARLKGVKRSSFIETDGFIIAHTEIGAFEGSVASYLLKGGADIALGFNHSEEKDFLRISGRVVKDMVEKGIDLGKIFRNLSKQRKDTEGGGHPGAAVLTVSNVSEEKNHYLELCLDSIISLIKEKELGRGKNHSEK